MKTRKKYLVVILGPTAVGKTEISIRLAKEFNTEIISADSRQIYKGMNIGTAKPDSDQLRAVPHHFIDYKDVWEAYNAGLFEKEALEKIAEIFSKKDIIIMCGGSGLYIKAVCEGFDVLPEGNKEIRSELEKRIETQGMKSLLAELREKDPVYYHEADIQNPQRVIRALEVIKETGKPYSSQRQNKKKARPFNIFKIGLTLEREEVYNRIEKRIDKMVDQGLFEEAKKLYKFRDQSSLQTVGYQEIFDYMDGRYDREETIRLIKRNTRRFAKRQLTWFRKDEEIRWLGAGDYDGISQYVQNDLL